jgi:hypothetical protein
MDGITVGSLVRFREVLEPADEKSRFVVVEDNGDRLLVRFVCDLPIPPLFTYRRDEMCLAE